VLRMRVSRRSQESLHASRPEISTSFANACQCRGCGTRTPAWIAEEYGSLTPSAARIRNFCNVNELWLHSLNVDIAGQPA